MTDVVSYRAKIDRLRDDHGRFDDNTVRQLFGLLHDARSQIVLDLTKLAGRQDSFQAWQLRELRVAIDRLSLRLHTEYDRILSHALLQSWQNGIVFARQVLPVIGTPFAGPTSIDSSAVNVILVSASDLVTRVTTDFAQRAKTAIAMGILGGAGPSKVIADIIDLLRAEPDRQGRRSTLASQAETITRTELARAFSIADRLNQGAIVKTNPDLRKWWMSARDSRVRQDHTLADEQYRPGGSIGPIPFDEKYIIGGHPCDMPHDPSLPADQTISCRCVSVLYSPSWFS